MAELTRRQTLLRAAAAGATVVLSRSAARAQNAVRISFVLSNDIYKMNEEKGRGGMPRLAAAVKAEKAKGGHVVFTHAGDMFSPSLMSGFDQGAHMVELLNAFAPDAFAPGNHEFDFGKEAYFKRIAEAKFPIVAANLRAADGSPLSGHKDALMLERGGVRIGLIGCALDSTAEHTSSGDLKFTSTADAIRDHGKRLRAEGADLIVALIHTDKALRSRLADSRAADLILTGHTHDVHIGFDGKALSAESGEEGQYVVIIDVAVDVRMDGGKRTIAWWPNYRIIDSATMTPDPDVLAIVKRHEGALSKELDVEVATLGAPLDSRTSVVRGGEAAIGNLIADALRDATGADLAITNGGGIRAGKEYPAGHKLTRRDILSELPFGNRTVTTRITGRAVRAAIENGLSQYENRAGRFPQVSGLRILASAAAPVGQRVQSIEVDGAPLDEAKTYLVATNDFMLRGGDGYTSLAGAVAATVDTGGKLMANDVMSYARKLGAINAKVEGRTIVR